MSRFRGGIAAVLVGGAIAGGIITQTGGGGGQSCPAFPSFPDAACTGVPSGVTLTTYTGPTTITTNNTVIDSKLITSGLDIQASGVIIKNSHITFNGDLDTGGDLNGARCQDESPCGRGATPLTIQDTEIDCGNNGAHVASYGTAIEDSNITLLRVDIHGCENGLSVDQKIDIRDSYIHDLFEDPTPTSHSVDGTHTDGIQFSSCHYTVSGTGCTGAPGYVPGAKDITIKHNRIEGWGVRQDGSLGAASTSAIITNRGPTNIDNNILIENNLFLGGHNAGGGNTIYCEQDGYTAVNERVINNHFSDDLGAYTTTDCSDESDVSGNVDQDTGAPFTLG